MQKQKKTKRPSGGQPQKPSCPASSLKKGPEMVHFVRLGVDARRAASRRQDDSQVLPKRSRTGRHLCSTAGLEVVFQQNVCDGGSGGTEESLRAGQVPCELRYGTGLRKLRSGLRKVRIRCSLLLFFFVFFVRLPYGLPAWSSTSESC